MPPRKHSPHPSFSAHQRGHFLNAFQREWWCAERPQGNTHKHHRVIVGGMGPCRPVVCDGVWRRAGCPHPAAQPRRSLPSIFLFPAVHRHDLTNRTACGGACETANAGLAQIFAHGVADLGHRVNDLVGGDVPHDPPAPYRRRIPRSLRR